ncbi:hypothetical protein SEA_GEAZY_54 [Gordonia phage GEazy]|nr:hypothetical protein SEA_GEAZY_54 [Gordonia phage GEazy]QDF16763.1 hypothetical protein SEA_HANNAHD_51 [Gordonia phage HannahD]
MFGFGRNRRRRKAEEEALRSAARKREAAEAHTRITTATFRDEDAYYRQARRRAQRMAATKPRPAIRPAAMPLNPGFPILHTDTRDSDHGQSASSHDSGSNYGGHSSSGYDGGSSSSGGGFDGGGGGF